MWISSNGSEVAKDKIIEVEIEHFNKDLKLKNKIVIGHFGYDGFYLEDGSELSWNWNIIKWRYINENAY